MSKRFPLPPICLASIRTLYEPPGSVLFEIRKKWGCYLRAGVGLPSPVPILAVTQIRQFVDRFKLPEHLESILF